MRTWRHSLALPLLLLTASAVVARADVRDKAGLFSPEAIKKANSELDRIQQSTGIPVTIETTRSLNGDTIGQAIPKYAQREGVRGVFVLIARDEGKIDVEASRDYHPYFNRPRYQSIYEAFLPGLSKKDFDSGLAAGVANIGTVLTAAKAEVGNRATPAAPVGRRPMNVPQGVPMGAKSGVSTLIGIVLLVLAVIVGFRIIGALMGAGRGQYGGPGYGGPGYGGGMMRGPGGYGGAPGYGGGGGGGGGFMSGLMGGVGGAIAGNWIYDQMTGRRHQVDQSGNVIPGSEGYGPPPDQGADWQGAGDGGGDFGGGGGDFGGGGGGGGGDWGGGSGGGGDWGGGGGGGGDWGGGGGGGDGGSW